MDRYKVIGEFGNQYVVKRDGDIRNVRVAGKFKNGLILRSEYPVVGDWVIIDDSGLIVEVCARRNSVARKRSGKKYEQQILAANIDYMFIVAPLDTELNLNKIDRFLLLSQTNKIEPVIVLTKADICEDVDACIDKMVHRYGGMMKVIISDKDTDDGINGLKRILQPEKTGIFVGPSGAGKSTLVNRLLNEEKARTAQVREKDKKGKHTTTNRQLYELEGGAFIIDTPGIREIGLWINKEIYSVSDELDNLARDCRFGDCSHKVEPGCAILDAVEKGMVSRADYRAYVKLKDEIRFAEMAQNDMVKYAYEKKMKIRKREAGTESRRKR